MPGPRVAQPKATGGLTSNDNARESQQGSSRVLGSAVPQPETARSEGSCGSQCTNDGDIESRIEDE